jgi:hypothetical protein
VLALVNSVHSALIEDTRNDRSQRAPSFWVFHCFANFGEMRTATARGTPGSFLELVHGASCPSGGGVACAVWSAHSSYETTTVIQNRKLPNMQTFH